MKIKARARREMSVAFTLRAVLLMTVMPAADAREVLTTLLGDLIAVPWRRTHAVPSGTVLSTWRTAIGSQPMQDLRQRAEAYRWRWDGSETALWEAKSALHDAGPGTGAGCSQGKRKRGHELIFGGRSSVVGPEVAARPGWLGRAADPFSISVRGRRSSRSWREVASWVAAVVGGAGYSASTGEPRWIVA